MITPSKEFIENFKSTPGAFSVCESIALMNITKNVISGNYFEAGSNAGKSGMSAAYGLPQGRFFMCDPIYDLTNLEAWEHTIQKHPANLAWDYAAAKDFKDKVKQRISFASSGKVEPVLLGSYSEKEIPLHGYYTYAFIDSDNHQLERILAETQLLNPQMKSGAIVAFHDFDNQYLSPRQVHTHMIQSGDWENIEINWTQIFDYVRENNLEEGNNSWHEKGSEEFPKFIGALKRK